mmetsp:Transcript_22402/g.32760  ORF Transcript_22402/g.32760 Transcript_22402/m.32760 type:complete len:267 (+) Transcript_22402:639-1439(+)
MGGRLNSWHDYALGRVLACIFTGADGSATIPGMTKVLALLGLAIDFTGRDVVAHAIDLIVGPPELTSLGVEVMAHRVAHTVSVNLAARPVPVHANYPADAGLGVEVQLVLRRDIKGLAQRDIKLVVRPDLNDPRGVIVAFFLNRNETALRHDRNRDNIRAFVEKLSRRVHHHTVALGNEKKPVLGKGHAIGDVQFKRRRKILHLISDAIPVTVHHRPNLVLFGADKQDRPLRCHCHVPGVGNQRIKFNLEPGGQTDVFQHAPDRAC